MDSEVANVSYSTATQRGVTNENGIFYYLEGETITFSIGELTFPAIPAAALLTPLDLAGAEDINDPRVINIARLLQTIDSDGDPSNGILASEVAIAAMQSLDFSLPVDDFANQAGITALLTAIDKAELVSFHRYPQARARCRLPSPARSPVHPLLPDCPWVTRSLVPALDLITAEMAL